MNSIPQNVTMMEETVASKGMMTGTNTALLVNAWAWIAAKRSKTLGEMEENVMVNGTMLVASLMVVIAVGTNGISTKNAKMTLLL